MKARHTYWTLGKRYAVGLLLTCFMLGLASAQDCKIGFVSVDRILRESAPAKATEARLIQEFAKRQKDLADMGAKLKAMSDKLDKDAPNLSDADMLKRRRELADMTRDYQRRQSEFQEDSTQRKNEAVASVLDQANKVVKQIAEAEKYDIILQDSVWTSPRIDITDKVLKVLAKSSAPQ